MREGPEIRTRRFANERLGGFYSELVGEGPPLLALDPALPYEEQEALVAEAECYRARSPKAGRKFCYVPRSVDQMDTERLAALRRCIEDVRPDWVERVRLAMMMDNELYTIVHLSGVPPYPAVAILLNLVERGELPET